MSNHLCQLLRCCCCWWQGNSSVHERIHLTLSATFPNLQNPKNISRDLRSALTAYRRRIKAEEKGKVVAVGWETFLNAALTI